jgi:syntaxin-binding protein 5
MHCSGYMASDILDVRRFSEATITSTGDILGWKGPAEMALINVFGRNLQLQVAQANVIYMYLLTKSQ